MKWKIPELVNSDTHKTGHIFINTCQLQCEKERLHMDHVDNIHVITIYLTSYKFLGMQLV